MKTRVTKLFLALAATALASCTCPGKPGAGGGELRATSGHLVAKVSGKLDEVVQDHPLYPEVKTRTKFLEDKPIAFAPGGLPEGTAHLTISYRDVPGEGNAWAVLFFDPAPLKSGPITGSCEFFDAAGASLVRLPISRSGEGTFICERPWIFGKYKAVDKATYDRAHSVSLVIEGDFEVCRK